jgi:hypothetical protein
MHETLEGQGELENLEHPDKKWAVRYLFDIRTETTVERPGLPSWATRKHSTGSVRPLVVGKAFPLGYYRLYTADGEILRVKNLGQAWAILAP